MITTNHGRADSPASQPTAPFCTPNTDPALPQTGFDPGARGVLREQRVTRPVVIDEDGLRIVVAAEFLVQVHSVGEIVATADRDRGQYSVGRRHGLGVVLAEGGRQLGEDIAIGRVRRRLALRVRRRPQPARASRS